MTATAIIEKQLRDFLDAGIPGMFEIQSDDLLVRCEFTGVDTMACSIRELTVGRESAYAAEKLRETCDALSTKLTYLLEPLQIIECDAELSTIQMRSNPPHADEQSRRYYELTATPKCLSLHRFEKQTGQPRVQIESVLTKEVAARLVGDLAGA